MELILNHIQKSFGDKKVLTDVSGTFEQGKIYGLLGRNGAGKTTLFNCLAEECKVDGGQMQICQNGDCRPLNNEDIGYVYSLPVLPEFLTGYEFVKFFMDINREKLEQSGNHMTPDDYFDLVKLDPEDRNRLIKGYSHGMKNKVQMLCFMIAKPPVVLLDEPLTSFDVVVALEMKNLLRAMKHNHIIIFSTHILQLASDLCDEIAVLHDGQLQVLDHHMLKDPNFESELIELLKDGADQ